MAVADGTDTQGMVEVSIQSQVYKLEEYQLTVDTTPVEARRACLFGKGARVVGRCTRRAPT